LVEAGRFIIIDAADDAAETEIEHHFKMMPLAALLYQRGFLALHAAAVGNEQGALLLAGDSGSGKSTLLATLEQRGWKVLADDLAIVKLSEQGKVMVYPTVSKVALWPVALEKMGLCIDSLPYVDANRREFNPSEKSTREPQCLRGIFRLNVQSKNEVVLEDLAVTARFKAVGGTLYNSHVADALCNRENYLRCAAAIAQSVPISCLSRPRGVWSVSELADIIERF
jgi:hypothetical protein